MKQEREYGTYTASKDTGHRDLLVFYLPRQVTIPRTKPFEPRPRVQPLRERCVHSCVERGNGPREGGQVQKGGGETRKETRTGHLGEAER